MFLSFGGILTDVDKKEPLRASERAAGTSLPLSFSGSMTLEAAAVVPLFLFFVMNRGRTGMRSSVLYQIRTGSRERGGRRAGADGRKRGCCVAAHLGNLCEKQSNVLPGGILLEAFLCGWRKSRSVFCPV